MKRLQTVLLQNNQGMSVEIINFGARIKSILFPVKGIATEMTVGYSNAVNINHFPNSILLPSDEYKRKIIYQFECI